MDKQEEGKEKKARTEIHYRINHIDYDPEDPTTPNIVKGNCGGRNYEIHQQSEKTEWFFADEPETKKEADSIIGALLAVVKNVIEEPDTMVDCFCSVCEEMRASPIRMFHALIVFPSGYSRDLVFMTTGNSEKSFRKAVRRSVKRVCAKEHNVYNATVKFLNYMSRYGFAEVDHFTLSRVRLDLAEKDGTVGIKIRVPKN